MDGIVYWSHGAHEVCRAAHGTVAALATADRVGVVNQEDCHAERVPPLLGMNHCQGGVLGAVLARSRRCRRVGVHDDRSERARAPSLCQETSESEDAERIAQVDRFGERVDADGLIQGEPRRPLGGAQPDLESGGSSVAT